MVLLAATTLSEGVIPESAAVATRIEGTATVVTREAPAGRPVGNNDGIAKNDRVEVQGNSRLELRLPGGGWLRLSQNARLTVRKLQFEKRTGALFLQAFLHNGKVWAKIPGSAAADSWVEVITGAGFAAGKEIVCGVDAEENTGAVISVYEGVAPAAGAAGNAVPPVSLRGLQQISVPVREGELLPRDFDLKTAIGDWVRWNLQRDAREGLASMTVAPASATVTRGGSLQFSAVAHYPDNTEKDVTPFATWSSSDANVATIGPSGTAAGAELGTATIAAAIEDIRGSTVLNVTRDIVSVKVTPASGSIANGAVLQFTARGTFSDRTVRDITTSAVWRSSNPAVAFVDAAGRAVGGNVEGTAVISASLGTKRGSARLRVRRELVSIAILPESATIIPGDTQRFGAIGSYSDKTTRDLTESAEWESSNIRIAVMDQVQPGRVLGQGAGQAAITATYGNKTGSATIFVESTSSP